MTLIGTSTQSESREKTVVHFSQPCTGRLHHLSLFSIPQFQSGPGFSAQSRLKIRSDSLPWTRMTQHYHFSYRILMQLVTHLVETLIFGTIDNIFMKQDLFLPLGHPPTLPQTHFQALVYRKCWAGFFLCSLPDLYILRYIRMHIYSHEIYSAHLF